MIKLKQIVICVVVLTALPIFVTHAHKGASGIIKLRMDSMSEMGDAVKAIADMVKGKTEYDVGIIQTSAASISDHSVKLLDYFPDTDASRMSKESEALPVIWESWDQFAELSKQLQQQSNELKAVASGGDKRLLRMAFIKTTKACSACHDDFRKPKE